MSVNISGMTVSGLTEAQQERLTLLDKFQRDIGETLSYLAQSGYACGVSSGLRKALPEEIKQDLAKAMFDASQSIMEVVEKLLPPIQTEEPRPAPAVSPALRMFTLQEFIDACIESAKNMKTPTPGAECCKNCHYSRPSGQSLPRSCRRHCNVDRHVGEGYWCGDWKEIAQ